MKILFTFAIITISLISFIRDYDISDLNTPDLFIDQICSNRIISFEIKSNQSSNQTLVNCNCTEDYGTIVNNSFTINGQNVQCSYIKKRRFITLFFSIFIPFGLDYLYLEQYIIFVIILFSCCFTMIGNCYRYTVSTNPEYFHENANLFFIVLGALAIILWIVNIFLTAFGTIKDGNNFNTVSDLHMLFLS